MLTRELRNKLLMLYSTGNYTHEQLSDKFNIPRNNVSSFFQRHKKNYFLPKPPRKKRKKQASAIGEHNIDLAYTLYQTGATLQKVGEKFGITRERVRQVFHKFNKISRPSGSQKKYHFCKNGHEMTKGKFAATCQICIDDRRARRANGLYLKTHCIHGHEYTPENTVVVKAKPGYANSRRCKTCHVAAIKRSREKINKVFTLLQE